MLDDLEYSLARQQSQTARKLKQNDDFQPGFVLNITRNWSKVVIFGQKQSILGRKSHCLKMPQDLKSRSQRNIANQTFFEATLLAVFSRFEFFD